jgi:hypothetical protein
MSTEYERGLVAGLNQAGDAWNSVYDAGFKAGAEAMKAAAVAMLDRAQQPAAALGVSLMKLPEPPK